MQVEVFADWFIWFLFGESETDEIWFLVLCFLFFFFSFWGSSNNNKIAADKVEKYGNVYAPVL